MDLIIDDLRAEIAKQNPEIAQLKKTTKRKRGQTKRKFPRSNSRNESKSFTPQNSPAPIPSPAVPLTLLQDPSEIGLFRAKMQQTFTNRLYQIHSQISTSLRKSGEGKRKLKMPRNPKADKQQVMEMDMESSTTEETESEDEDP
ncbi:hypothetical protein HPB48_002310 [Haemaphysalis longicornis]|uniref:Uncharacterized protein n=1 Tax=Haemaphysalis longicornis TaxID=44386 RepID=A0A9J6GLM4_HAELO|nr:hypothetical protein HPB48_002310 [Haemaphysalis longicornis]